MAATNRFINISSCSFTPSGGSLTNIKGVKSVSLAPNAQILKESGDADFFNTFTGAVAADYVVTVETINAAALNAIAPGAVGTLTFTLNDARNGSTTGQGALIYTIANAVFDPQTLGAQHRQMATNSYQFHTYSTDGTTSPVGVAAA